MTSYSYSDWNSLSQEQQQNFPGVSVPKGHPLNNPNRGPYWSGDTAARALMNHIEDTLTGEDREAAGRMWNELGVLASRATTSGRVTDKALFARRDDANRALGAYTGDMSSEQLEQLVSVMDDVVDVQDAAIRHGVNPQYAASRMMNRAAGKAVGFDVSDTIEQDLRGVMEDVNGRRAVANLDQSVRQLHNLTKGLPLDALDSAIIGQDATYDEDAQIHHRRLNDILASIPLVLQPVQVEGERNFSVRMEDQKEANVVEWAIRMRMDEASKGFANKLPDNEHLRDVFTAARDAGVVASPFGHEASRAVGIIAGQGNQARENLEVMVDGLKNNENTRKHDFLVLAVEGGESLNKVLAGAGREIVPVKASSNVDGAQIVRVDGQPRAYDKPVIEVLDISRAQADDPVARSLAANAFVGESKLVNYVQGARMNAVEAQAVHVAGSSRKMHLAVSRDLDKDGSIQLLDSGEMKALRSQAQQIDKDADAQRYFTAGISRPANGVYGVAFESARHFEKANKKLAPGTDLIAEAYARIPKHATILQVAQEDGKNAAADWLKTNVRDRKVLYGEAKRSLSFATDAGMGLEGERHRVRIAETKFEIYDRPAHAREYAFLDKYGKPEMVPGKNQDGNDVLVPKKADYQAFLRSEERDRQAMARMSEDGTEHAADANRIRVGVISPKLDWDHQDTPGKVRGAIIQVTGAAQDRALNGTAQGIKVAQEKVMDAAHVAIVMSDFGKDIHAAHMIMLAEQMGKPATVFDGKGAEIPLRTSREFSAAQAQTTTETRLEAFKKRADYALGSDVGQLALMAMPGMDAKKAAMFGGSEMTIKELITDRSVEMQQVLGEIGLSADSRRSMNDSNAWGKALDRAEGITAEVERSGATLHRVDEKLHPLKLVNGPDYEPTFPIVQSRTRADFDLSKMPIAAFIGGSDLVVEPGAPTRMIEKPVLDKEGNEKTGEDGKVLTRMVRDPRGSGVDPSEKLDREQIRGMISEFSDKGYAIGVTLDSGVSKAVMEEARNVPDAKLVIVSAGNPKAAAPALMELQADLQRSGKAMILSGEQVAPNYKDGADEANDTARYVQNTAQMREILAEVSKVGVLVASNTSDQALHTLRRMVEADKPIAVMVNQDMGSGGSEIYKANDKLLRGEGQMTILSERPADATVAKGYANISDKETGFDWQDGVRRGNAGTFQSEQFSRSELMRSGHHGLTFGWANAARPISSPASIDRLVADVEQGTGPVLGKYEMKTEKELEKNRLAWEQGRMSSLAQEVKDEFSQFSRIYGHDIKDTTMEHNNARREAGLSVTRDMEAAETFAASRSMGNRMLADQGFGR